MNIYFCYHKNDVCGLYVAADTIGKAKALYAKWDGMENFTEYRGYVMRKDVDVPAGVSYTSPDLERLGLVYDLTRKPNGGLNYDEWLDVEG